MPVADAVGLMLAGLAGAVYLGWVTVQVCRRLGDLRYVGFGGWVVLRYALALLALYLLFLYAWRRGYLNRAGP